MSPVAPPVPGPSGSTVPGPDVTVVGAGPVGMTVAALLGARGWHVEVREKHLRPWGRPRAVHLDHQAARILDAAGVMSALAGRTEAMDAYEWRTATGEVLLRMEAPDGPGRSGWPESSMFTQPDLEEALEGLLAALPTVTLRRGAPVASAGEVDGTWVVAADGADSTLRAAAGIGVDDGGFAADWFIVDVVPHRPSTWRPLNVQVCDPARPTTAVSGGPGRRRFEFMVLPGEDAAALATEAGAWALLAPWGIGPDDAVLERHALYRFGDRVARQWRAGRVLLAGDAAHQMPPFAGQGLCAGLRDAANLAWKLDLVLAGTAPEALLDTYGAERSVQVRTEIAFSTDLGRIICVTDPAEAAARDAGMVAAARESGPIPPPPGVPLGPGVTLGGDPHAGTLSVQGVLTHDGRTGPADDVVGRGFVLYGRDGDPAAGLDPATAAWFAGLGGRAVDCSGAPEPYPGWFAETAAAVILVRPDFAVFGTAAPDGAEALVTALRARLRGPS